MTVDTQAQMTDEEVDDFLLGRQVGVLSLSQDSEPYSVPVTYYFDDETRRFYFRLILPPGSHKRRFLTKRPLSRLVVYEEDPPRYRSVIARGRPREIGDGDVDLDYVEQFGSMMRPLFEMWSEPKPNLDIKLYEFDPTMITGRRIAVDPDA